MRRAFALTTALGALCFVFLSRYTTVLPWLSWWKSVRSEEDEDLEASGYLIRTPECHIPAWDPFDPSVAHLYRKVADFVCPGRPSFLRVRPNAVLIADDALLWRYYKLKHSQIKCTYREVYRTPNAPAHVVDDRYNLSAPKQLTFGQPLKVHHAIVNCFHNRQEVLVQHVPLVPLSQELERKLTKLQKSSENSGAVKLNVLMVGVDSISNLNFERHMPRTKAFLKDVLGAVQLHGYTKIGDNTFPNIVALLTGHFLEYYWNESLSRFTFDGLDFVWKDFAKRGYRSLFAEDAPNIATFNYLKHGFSKPPADYYLRPLCLATENSAVRSKAGRHCWGSKMEMEVVFDYLADFVEACESRPHFGFAFVARLTHDTLNNAGYADAPSVRLLERLYGSGALKNTLLVFFSDHGLRFGPIRSTFVGKLEERMPIMFLAFPETFAQQYPAAVARLRTNTRRLTTPFDVHATLQHLASFPPEHPHRTMHGVSLFHEVPFNRSCDEAFIFPHWCTCQNRTVVPVNDPGVINASHALVSAVNSQLESRAELCSPLALDKVVDATVSQPNDKVLRFVRHYHDVIGRGVQLGKRVTAPLDYMVTVMVKPSNALLEATIRYYEPTEQYVVLGDVSRLNMYGSQGECISDAVMRKFCYCRTQVNTARGPG
ncbi:uncharacterized protein LOC119382698 [Rhipicephalus sanguineus]|uniref:Uncharacterized protein n=1 Tax=Rhipicephalus sanguineus TaxID=34632 RepID=A0A9D4Q4Q4_RHISA|nr:uncharacterized protein LOC119382698 [Rhipicephalus sanguineus]KAH7968050.1 hypothetical protein HPB52_005535 [Rhipicephalus sanguineus]